MAAVLAGRTAWYVCTVQLGAARTDPRPIHYWCYWLALT